ncbi:bifunctional diaminohydroxyphosphoribosylaminopyrimidine deaminase/5-amino-6-(5-phosphoribosylamino)uracil reductase RibD [Pseudomonas sp. LJDD11]|uniref:bifunctional diaminohydroxyphosphoribosylaminopyrimidine deaminase/5-amino-6-(5-phosphoribosylamino)uracil reductase RibD n=1 Tax=Pseudomonas sp. LJDD11 TaxID=2931984 RepID=UPI00211BF733|nr:bifunctional diaminohydroxyphosphoribosylaminopyrimidine deaminase/5-amino-6-(5-phosphoribosylamino)uracil reductase RibD [Pseudomonas sp. LJDD11]MCQ9425738.1 bifunctional diaminohydroxyphosphoribosylaminopyrimidine deaminase/5-amino-6-(5-phosphoribosylamino)uracil reductase RibD [Pseudomonas sp. LJDD11]
MSLTAEHSIFSESDRLFMNQALEQGRRALPGCQPNPPVGCVIVSHGVVVASGYTQPPGQHHEEAMALSRLAPGLDELTAYVTLEPCSFAGRTPSCALALVSSGIKRVHVAMLDPDPRNAGAGIAILQQAGIAVTLGLLEEQAGEDLGAYLHRGLGLLEKPGQ